MTAHTTKPRDTLLAIEGDYIFRATGDETTEDAETDATVNAGFTKGDRLKARAISHRTTKRGIIYTWAKLPGGKFDLFETLGLPNPIRKAPAA